MHLTPTMTHTSQTRPRIRTLKGAAGLCILATLVATGCGSDRAGRTEPRDRTTVSSPSAEQRTDSLPPSRESACERHEATLTTSRVSEQEARDDQELLLRDLDRRKIRVGTLNTGRCGDDVVIYLGLTVPVDVPTEGVHGTPVLTFAQQPFEAR